MFHLKADDSGSIGYSRVLDWFNNAEPINVGNRRFGTNVTGYGESHLRGGGVPQISVQEFERLPLRVHAFLEGVPLHDAWVIDLPRSSGGITLDEFLRAASGCLFRPSPAVRALLNVRFFVGRLFGWDRAPSTRIGPETFSDRLTAADRERSLAPAGLRDGLFRVVYRFENEQLLELINRTAHAAALSALVETAGSYRYYLAVYVRSVGQLTPVYMMLIDPFRKLVVYPSLLRGVRASWNQTMGGRLVRS